MTLPFFMMLSPLALFASPKSVDALHINKAKDNLFVGVGFGVQAFYGNPSSDFSLGDRLSPKLNAYVGKWVTPSSGIRIAYNGLTFKDNKKKDVPYFNVHGDYLWNVHNSIFGYKEARLWNISSLIGMGWAASRGENTNDGFAVNLGLYNTFRFSEAVYATAELGALFANKEFDLAISDKYSFDKLFSFSVGVSYRFKKRGWDTCSVVRLGLLEDQQSTTKEGLAEDSLAADTAVAAAEAQLRSQLDECLKRQSALVSELDAERKKMRDGSMELSDLDRRLMAKTVFFASASSAVPNKYMVDMRMLVAFAKKNGYKLKVTGYADNATGTADFNLALSRKRAQAVASLLEKLGVSRSDLLIDAVGGKMDADDVKYNRRVTVELEK